MRGRERERGGCETRLAIPSGVQSDLRQASHSAPEYRRGEQEVNFTQGFGSGRKAREANVRKQPGLTWYFMAGLAICSKIMYNTSRSARRRLKTAFPLLLLKVSWFLTSYIYQWIYTISLKH